MPTKKIIAKILEKKEICEKIGKKRFEKLNSKTNGTFSRFEIIFDDNILHFNIEFKAPDAVNEFNDWEPDRDEVFKELIKFLEEITNLQNLYKKITFHNLIHSSKGDNIFLVFHLEM